MRTAMTDLPKHGCSTACACRRTSSTPFATTAGAVRAGKVIAIQEGSRDLPFRKSKKPSLS
jgi:hypothetical protein